LSVAGYRDDGSRYVMFSFFGGGLGGNPQSDGLNHANNPISMATIPPAEILEASYPVKFTQWALRPDSAGAGYHRGGVGAIYELETMTNADVFLLGERGIYPPLGVAGGGPAALNRFVWQSDEGDKSPELASKITDVRIRPGQRIRIEAPGGGGFGDPMTRPADKVARDVRLGFVTREAARTLYGVALGADGQVDQNETRQLRKGAAA
jgi:N-methylhydantoinase B